ncbi:hypothetical protein FEZ20_005165 [Escherichia coli]|nr:hypothetical protein [Escherichia coli]EGO7975118.1 hypothetical protein [Escherichia coli]EGO7980490.1 hypothetical protein [Escherichia coli]EGO8002906.1 hypothetical protein [Escherichia coli]
MDPLLIIHGSVYWIGPPDMWINHSGKTAYTTDYEGFRAYLLTVTTDTLRFLAGSRASPGHRSAASVNAKIIGRFSPFLMSAIGH